MNYSIVVFPSAEVQEVANSYRKRYDPTFALIPPFVRLKDIFELEDASLAGLVSHLERVAEDTTRFPVVFSRFTSFYPANNVIYLAIYDKQPFEQLHEKIMGYWPNRKESYLYIPHLTVGRNLSTDELRDVTPQLKTDKVGLSTEVDSFHLIYEQDDLTWAIKQTFHLRSK